MHVGGRLADSGLATLPPLFTLRAVPLCVLGTDHVGYRRAAHITYVTCVFGINIGHTADYNFKVCIIWLFYGARQRDVDQTRPLINKAFFSCS